jgi:hypothetical protein
MAPRNSEAHATVRKSESLQKFNPNTDSALIDSPGTGLVHV